MRIVDDIERVLRVVENLSKKPDMGGLIVMHEIAKEAELSGVGTGNAVIQLLDEDLLQREGGQLYKLTARGKTTVRDLISLWEDVAAVDLEPADLAILHALNARGASHGVEDLAIYDPKTSVGERELRACLGRRVPSGAFEDAIERLNAAHFIRTPVYVSGSTYQSRYRGLVREARAGFIGPGRFIDRLLKRGERATHDFKREQYLSTSDQKAEFLKDLIALADSQGDERERHLVVGFEPKHLTYFGPPSQSLTQDRFEQLVSVYIEPWVEIRYAVVEHRRGKVGLLTVVQDPRLLPYRARKDLRGQTRTLSAGDIYVRRGSHTDKARPEEIAELHALAYSYRGASLPA